MQKKYIETNVKIPLAIIRVKENFLRYLSLEEMIIRALESYLSESGYGSELYIERLKNESK